METKTQKQRFFIFWRSVARYLKHYSPADVRWTTDVRLALFVSQEDGQKLIKELGIPSDIDLCPEFPEEPQIKLQAREVLPNIISLVVDEPRQIRRINIRLDHISAVDLTLLKPHEDSNVTTPTTHELMITFSGGGTMVLRRAVADRFSAAWNRYLERTQNELPKIAENPVDSDGPKTCY